jgi:hypothetical protein
VIVDDCDGDFSKRTSSFQALPEYGMKEVNDAWRHSVALGIIKPLSLANTFFDTCEHVGLCIGRYV